ncbi:MAG TPA: DsbA family protein [Solirubrobacteraceae bacterium]|nr:DsbA family protein [Solirubrobacteraceae bacterium]
MGDLLHFPTERTRPRAASVAPQAVFCFDVRDPFSYLVAERVERRLPDATWVAVDAHALDAALGRAHAEAEARRLRIPLVWPERFPVSSPRAQRAAAFACEVGAGPAFALAAARLAFCGGFSLEDLDVIAEAAAAAAVPLGPCLEAAAEGRRDEELREATAALRAAGVRRLPAVRIGSRWRQGDGALEAAAALLERSRLTQGPLAPAG